MSRQNRFLRRNGTTLLSAAPMFFFKFKDYNTQYIKYGYSEDYPHAVNKNIKNSARSFGHKILMYFVAHGIKHAENQRRTNAESLFDKIHHSEKRKTEKCKFTEVCQFTKSIVRNNLSAAEKAHKKSIKGHTFARGNISTLIRKKENHHHGKCTQAAHENSHWNVRLFLIIRHLLLPSL